MKFRLPGRRSGAEIAPESSADLTSQLIAASGKGRPTPKRSEAQGRRTGPPPPPPTTRKEAYQRSRQQQAARRVSAREGMAMGGDAALPARDRGPLRRHVRNVVDARRNLGSFFLPVAVLILVGNFAPNGNLQGIAILIWTAYFLLLAVDSYRLGRKISTSLRERFPNEVYKSRSLVWYGISRSTMIRRWRFPKPEVAVGQAV